MRFVTSTLRDAAAAVAAMLIAFFPAAASAQNGMPQPWQMNLQPAATEVATFIHWFHDWINILIVAISVFVLALIVYVAYRFNERRNPVPAKTTHHALLEVAWTIIPVLILVVVAIPSFRLLKLQLEVPKADITVKVTGKQWYWSYEYPQDGGAFGFDSKIWMEAIAELALDGADICIVGIFNVDRNVRVAHRPVCAGVLCKGRWGECCAADDGSKCC